MPLLKRALLAAVLALPQAIPAARAAPHEINVFTDELEEPGEIGLEMHVNYARGRDSPDYPGELPPDKVWRVMPSLNCRARIPIPTKFDRWIRSKLSAITALTPTRFVPFAARSREEPVPYSLPAITIKGFFASMYFIAAS